MIRPTTSVLVLGLALAGALASAGEARAQAAGEQRSALDGVFTNAQAELGNQVWDVECSICHVPQEFTGRIFQIAWVSRPVHDLFREIKLTMPFDRPGGLDDEQYAAVVAYILRLNEYPSGDEELPADEEELSRIKLEPLPDSRED